MSDLDRLMRFAAVAEELSFSEAARRLRVDQPWLSRQIQQLEAQLGFTLFVRSTRSVRLTPQGEALFEHARELARVASECRRAARDLMRSQNCRLALGVTPYSFWVPEREAILEAFQIGRRVDSVDISSNYTPRLLSKLRKGIIDVALISQPFDYPDLEALVIHSSPVRLLVPREDPLAKRRVVPIASLSGRSMAVTDPTLNPGASELVYGPFFAAGVIPQVVPEGAQALAFYAASRRLPIALVGWPHIRDGELPDFVPVDLEPPAPLVRYALLRRNEAARGLLEHFWATAARVVEERDEAAGARPRRTADPAGVAA